MRNLLGVLGVAMMVTVVACGGNGQPAKGDGGAGKSGSAGASAGSNGGAGTSGAGTSGAGTSGAGTSGGMDAAAGGGVAGTGSVDGGGTDAPTSTDAPGAEVAADTKPDVVVDLVAETAPPCVPVADRVISDVAGQSGRPALAWNGNGYGVVWPDDRSGTSQIFFARLDRAGAPVGQQAPVTSGAASNLPDLAWGGDAYGLAYVTEAVAPGQVHFSRVSAVGAPLGPVSDMPGAGVSSLVWTGTHYGMSYHSARGDAGAQTDIYVSRFDASGARVGTETQLTTDPAASFIPTITWTGSRYGVSFQDSRLGAGHVFVGLVDANGAKIGAEASVTPVGGGASSIASNGSGFAVTYSDAVGPKLVRLDADGKRVGTDAPIGGAPAQIAWTGTKYAFAYSAAGKAVYLATIDNTALVASSPVLVSDANAAGTVNAIALVWNGSGYAVAWRDERAMPFETHFAIVCPP